jgi:pimeloyl-ACP methyl ester carboxylesterase
MKLVRGLLLGIVLPNSMVLANELTFPKDFPVIIDQGGLGKGDAITGFGGISGGKQNENRLAISRRPVIFVHGNAGNALHKRWGGLTWRDFLLKQGYNEAEIWGLSYLGHDNHSHQLDDPHRTNVQDLATFINTLCEYLDVDKVDLVGHSLGGSLIKAAIAGYDSDGIYKQEKELFAKVGTVVGIASAFYGLGSGMFVPTEFKTGGSFESRSHLYKGVFDDTPYGASHLSQQQGEFQGTTELDDDQIYYVAVNAVGDFVDSLHQNTSRLVGAHLNIGIAVGSGRDGHENIIKSQKVFDLVFPYLNRNLEQD